MPGMYVPTSFWLELLSVDKLVHAGLFFGLAWLLWIYSIKNNLSLTIIISLLLLAVLYGVSVEIMQARWFSGRSFEVPDMVANAVGIFLSFVFRKSIVRFVQLGL